MMHVLLWLLLFSGYDFVGYNLTKGNADALQAYRISQVALQAGITVHLWQDSPREAIAFNVCWWAFVADLLYYAWAYVFNIRAPFENRSTVPMSLHSVTWAYWSPAGIAYGADRSQVIPLPVLAWQSFFGLHVSFIILEGK